MQTLLVHALFAGGISVIGDGGHRSGLRKQRREGAVWADGQGMAGDEIVDLRSHGGPDRALSLFAFEHYADLQKMFPEAAEPLIAGSMGENIVCQGGRDQDFFIGDIYRAGDVVFQISQPRSPCWKLNQRFGIPHLSKILQEQHRAGCYARVLTAGFMSAGQAIMLQSRPAHSCSIAAFWEQVLCRRPDPAVLSALANTAGLAEEWRVRLTDRISWLEAQQV